VNYTAQAASNRKISEMYALIRFIREIFLSSERDINVLAPLVEILERSKFFWPAACLYLPALQARTYLRIIAL